MKCLKDITAPFSRMVKQGQEKLTQWKEVQGRRLLLLASIGIYSISCCFVLNQFFDWCFLVMFRMESFRVMLVSSQEL